MDKLKREAVVKLFAEKTLFRGEPAGAIDRLAALVVQKTIPKDYRLFSMGQECECLYFLYSGRGVLVRTTTDGRERIILEATSGDMVGTVGFFGEVPHTASFVAETECVVLALPREGFERLVTSVPRLALAVLRGVAHRLRTTVALLEQMSFEDASHRLWHYLVDGSRPEGAKDYPRVFEPLPTREHIAHTIGTVREVVSRKLSYLVDEGHVQIEGRRLRLLKPLD